MGDRLGYCLRVCVATRIWGLPRRLICASMVASAMPMSLASSSTLLMISLLIGSPPSSNGK